MGLDPEVDAGSRKRTLGATNRGIGVRSGSLTFGRFLDVEYNTMPSAFLCLMMPYELSCASLCRVCAP